jgi:ADP-ribose pyrophosphatase
MAQERNPERGGVSMATIEPEPTVESRKAFEGKLISVRVDTVRLSSGKTTQREIVEHPTVVAVLPVLDGGGIVFVRQFRKAVERILLEIPAGGIDGDESPEDAVRREMKEETGYDVGKLEFLCTFYTSPGITTELMYLYKATELRRGQPTEETDQIQVLSLSPQDARVRIASGEIQDAKTILALGYA